MFFWPLPWFLRYGPWLFDPVYPQLSLHACLPSWVLSLSLLQQIIIIIHYFKLRTFFLVQNQTLIPTALLLIKLEVQFYSTANPHNLNVLFVWPHNITHPTLFPLFAGSVMLGFSLLFLFYLSSTHSVTSAPLFLAVWPQVSQPPPLFLPQPCTTMSSSQTVSQLWVCLSFHCISSVFSFFYLTVGYIVSLLWIHISVCSCPYTLEGLSISQ